MQYLIDLHGRHRGTGADAVFRFCTGPGGYNTRGTDDPPHAHYAPRINQPGNYRRALFGGQGRTNGVAEVDTGTVLLNNADGGLDDLLDYAFDGYELKVWSLSTLRSPYSSRTLVMRGTVEQAEIIWEEVRLRTRSRLALLDVPIQLLTYAGTTNTGGMDEAEGEESLKDAPKPLLYGAPLNVPALLVNRFHQIYTVSSNPLQAVVRVRDKGAVITAAGADYPTVAALRTATIPDGQYATCLALGLIRFGGNVVQSGQVTVDAVDGASAAMRTAGQVARRILVDQAGLVPGVDFLEADIAALDAKTSAVVGYWTGTNPINTLEVVSTILDSVGAYIAPDRLGVFRIGRFEATSGPPEKTFTEIEILEEDGTGIQRLATGDEGNGLPAKKVTIQYARNHAVTNENALSGDAITNDPSFVAFAKEEWRQEIAEDAAVAGMHKLAPEMTFQTCLVEKADAAAEAVRRQALYGTYRDRYDVPVPPTYAQGIDLDDDVALRLRRFGLDAGKSFVVTGMVEDLDTGISRLDVWG